MWCSPPSTGAGSSYSPAAPPRERRVCSRKSSRSATAAAPVPSSAATVSSGRARRRCSFWIRSSRSTRARRRRRRFGVMPDKDHDMSAAPDRCRLYLITPPRFEPTAFAENFRAALDADDVGCVQLRLKEADDDAVRRAADILRPIAQERGVAFLMNDRPDLVAETGCDGVHIGQDDMGYAEARRMVGDDAIVGVTCKASRHLAMEAAERGADYVAFGAFFPTATQIGRASCRERVCQ